MSAGGEEPGGQPPGKLPRVDDGDLREALLRAQAEIRRVQERAQEEIQRAQEATQRAQARAQEEIQRAQEATQRAQARAQEAIQRAVRDGRITTLRALTARNLPDIPIAAGGGSRSSATAELTEGVVVLEDVGDAAVDALLPPAGDPIVEERVCRELESLLRQREVVPTPTTANEIEFWQRYIAMVLEFLRRIAQRDGLAMLKVHHDKPASSSHQHRPDFAFTSPNEHLPYYSTTCFVLEAKPRKRSGQSPASLLRESAAQCISYLAARQKACDYLPQTGYGLATVGEGICIVRIDFSQSTAPVHLSSELPFLPTAAFRPSGAGEAPQWGSFFAEPLALTAPGPTSTGAGAGSAAATDAGDGTGAPAAAPPILPGLRALVRLVLMHDLSVFGLGRIAAMPPAGGAYAAGELLGEGGYANVSVWRHTATGEDVAAKFLRVPGDGDGNAIELEAGVLAALEAAGVPRVPRLALPPGAAGASRLAAAEDGRPVLLLRPIGVPLRRYVAALPDVGRAAAAAAMGLQVWDTLVLAHAAGYLHGDVRPGNIVRVDGAPGGRQPAAVDWQTREPSWMLIDWGLGERVPAASRESTKMRGERAFLSDRRLRILAGATASSWVPTPQDDLDAAMLTFVAVAAGSDCGASWPRGALVTASNVMKERWTLSVEDRREAVEAAVALLPPGSALRAAAEAYMAAPPGQG